MRLSLWLPAAVAATAALAFAQDAESDDAALEIEGAIDPVSGLESALDEILEDGSNSGFGSLDARSLFGRQAQCPAYAPRRCIGGCCLSSQKCVSTD